jgi:hypothetical protein
MTIYTFRPNHDDGPGALIRFVNLPSDSLAKAHAWSVLDDHPASGSVQVWEGERLVDSVARPLARRPA